MRSARDTFCCSDYYGDAIDRSSRTQICRFRRLAIHSLLLCRRMPTSTTVASQSGFPIKPRKKLKSFGSRTFNRLLQMGAVARLFVVPASNYDLYCEPISHVAAIPHSNWRSLLFGRGIRFHAIKYTLVRREHGCSPIGSGKRHLDYI
jgi:hypothetical protein